MSIANTYRVFARSAVTALFLAFPAMSAWAITLPVAEATSTSVVRGNEVIRGASGRSPLLSAAGPQRVLVRFNYSNLPANIQEQNIVSVQLKLYVSFARLNGGGAW
jgi:hypothetical protein